MKRGICIFLALLLVMVCTGCSVQETTNNPQPTTECQHAYSTATCLSASRCSKCGATRGGLGAHTYSKGVCTYCNAKDPYWEPPLLTGTEYERINSLMEGMYQFRISTGNLVEYNFEGGSFVCYTQIGGSVIENSGTYKLTEETLILYYQNGTVKDCRWKLNSEGAIELFLLELD